MASIANSSKNVTNPAATLSSRRGQSARSRDKQFQNNNTQQNNDQQQNTQASGMGQTKNLLTKKYKKPAYLQSLNESEKAENFKIIDNMSKKISYVKNPRFKVNKAPILLNKKVGQGEINDPKNPFRVEPSIIQFIDYQVNGMYEIPLKVTNGSQISKRLKFIPPESENFTVRNVKYPSKVNGDIAPGMSLVLSICFCAPSFADFDDNITFVTEENSFKVPITARREPPQISLVNPLDCLQSWLGDRVDMAFRCVNNGGDGGFKFFCERDEDDQRQVEQDIIRIGAFTLTPSEFYLYSGNAIDIYVSFAPDQEGQQEENLILACDNQTSEFYKLTGYGAMLDLDVTAVDNKEIDFKKNPFETLHFENTNPTSQSVRKLMIKNSSPILIPFHWSIFKQKNTNKIILQDEQTHYKVEPTQGKIQAGESAEFTIYFSPDHAEPYYEYVDLIVEDIPIQSVRNPPDGLKQFAVANAPKTRVPMPTYVGSNTQFLSVPLITFNLKGQGNSCAVGIDPPILFFEGDCFINHYYTKKVSLKKDYEGTVRYKLILEGKNSDEFQVDATINGQSLKDNNWVISGEINTENEIEVEVNISSSECGEKIAYFYLEIQDGAPQSFSCKANFRGPIISISEAVVEYGLVKINTEEKYSFYIENTSPIQAELIIKNSKNKRLNFQTFDNYGQQVESEEERQNILNSSKTSKGNVLQINQTNLVLEPFQKTQVSISLQCIQTEFLEEYFEIMVKDSQSQFFQILAEIQKPKITLNRNIIELGKIYAGVTEEVSENHKQCIVLKNYGNLPALFHWQEKIDQEKIIARFEPARGIVRPQQEVYINFTATVFVGGKIDELFICDIDDLEIPLGFEFHADAFGLNVTYETQEDQSGGLTMTQGSFQKTFQQSFQGTQMSGSAMKTTMRDTQQKENQNKLKMLTFPSCTINKTSTQKFIIKNLSGIKTSFKLSSQNFEPLSHQAPSQKSEVQKAQEKEQYDKQQETKMNDSQISSPDKNQTNTQKEAKQLRFAPSAKSGLSNKQVKTQKKQSPQKKLNRPILSDEHEQTQKFSSATGNTFTQTKKFEKEAAYFLSNNKGIAIVFTPNIGELPPHSEIPITVTVYNNICGRFDDKIISEVKGLPPMEFPVSIAISGSPVVIPLNQVGLNYKSIPPTLPMPTIVCNSQPITKTFKIKNTGIRTVQIDWKIFDRKDLVNKETDLFDLSVAKNFSFDRKDNPYKFHFEAIEPEESTDSAFEVYPKQSVVSSREIQTFQVTFHSDKGVGDFNSIIIATPELTQEELEIAEDGDEFQKKGSLGIISLNLTATTLMPKLTIDKKFRADGEYHMNFKYWSLQDDQDTPKSVQKIIFTNDTKADLTFNFNMQGPFEIVKTKSNTGAKHPLAAQQTSLKVVNKKAETMFCLQPLKIVEAHIEFKAPLLTSEEWPMTIKNERHGELIAYFANGDYQKLILDAYLLRPKIELLTEKPSKNDKAIDELDFGTVNIDKHRTIKVFLSNITEVTAKWNLNYVKFPKKQTIGYNTTTPWEVENMQKNDDPDVFEFSATDGALKGKSLPLRIAPEGLSVLPLVKDEEEKQYLPQTVYINFRPKANVLYKSKFRFTVTNGISCDIILKGKGSYEENYD